MRKKFLVLTAAAMAAMGVAAQVGVNTETPKTTLDIVQTDKSTNPGHGFRLDDGNQDEGKIIMGDADGVGTWHSSDDVLSAMPYVDMGSLFVAQNGWLIVEQAAQRYGKIIQIRLLVTNTVDINIDANHMPPSNIRIAAKSYLAPYRYVVYMATPADGAAVGAPASEPYNLCSFIFSNQNMMLRTSSMNTVIPTGSTFLISGFFMWGAMYDTLP
jgi:hypothetical protein